jgi:hypothetical protein
LKLLLPALAAALVLAAPAQAAPVIGIGDQYPGMFSDPRWQALDVPDVRYMVSWNALHHASERRDLDAYMAAARAAGARVLLGLNHARGHHEGHRLPSVRAYSREFAALHKRYPWVTDFETWNEENLCGQPTCRNPKRAAQFYNAARRRCPDCRIVGADLLDVPNMAGWARRFRRYAKGPLLWGLHNYLDANRFTTSGTRTLLRTVRGDIWFTETGGLVRRTNGSKIRFAAGIAHAGRATTQVFRLAALSRRIKRVYFYQWAPAPDPHATWDSALTDRRGRARPALAILQAWLRRHGSS